DGPERAPHGEQLAVGAGPGDAERVVSPGGGHPGHRRAVVVVDGDGVGVVVVVGEVPAAHVVDEAVAVVVRQVARDLAGVHVEVRGEVLVGGLHAVVHHRDDDVRRAGRQVPGFGRVDVGVRLPAVLPRVVEVPLAAEKRVV